jgi:hypothetical protein
VVPEAGGAGGGGADGAAASQLDLLVREFVIVQLGNFVIFNPAADGFQITKLPDYQITK